METQGLVSMQEKSTSLVQRADFLPIHIVEVELALPLPTLSSYNTQTGQYYKLTRCLVRLHTQPLGVVELIFEGAELSPQELATTIWRCLEAQIIKHLHDNGMPLSSTLTEAGLSPSTIPRCLEMRNLFLATAPFVSVIVPTHDRPERVATCLPSLLALDYPNYEIIIVDNAPSTNATSDLIKQYYSDIPQLHYVVENQPGISRARNRGTRAARGEIIAFTDDDAIADRHWLTELVKAFSATDNVACVTGLVLPLELDTHAQLWFEEFGGFSKGFTRRIFDMQKYHPKTPLYPYAAGYFGTGANMAFRADFLDSVGGYDPELGSGSLAQGGEDLDLFFQAIMSGHRLVYEPASLVYHQHRRSYKDLHAQIYTYGVGLTAYLTKIIVSHPLRLLDFICKVPYGIFFAFSTRSPKNCKKSPAYPSELSQLELKGMLYGPVAYIRSCWALRNAHRDRGTY